MFCLQSHHLITNGLVAHFLGLDVSINVWRLTIGDHVVLKRSVNRLDPINNGLTDHFLLVALLQIFKFQDSRKNRIYPACLSPRDKKFTEFGVHSEWTKPPPMAFIESSQVVTIESMVTS